MIKRDELTNPESCMSRARDDEMTFVLLGRDKAAPLAIRSWVMERIRLGKNKPEDPQVMEALACAKAMDGKDPAPDDMVWITRAEMKAYSDWHQEHGYLAPVEGGVDLEGFAISFDQALRQWKMYAENEDYDLDTSPVLEAKLYRECTATLARIRALRSSTGSPASPPTGEGARGSQEAAP